MLGLVGGPFGYHNPSMTASPFSTLPRRMGSSASTSVAGDGSRTQAPSPFALPNPVTAPIMELVEGSNFGTMRAASLGRNSGLNPGCMEPSKNEVSRRPGGQNGLGICVRTPQLVNDDRESCVWICFRFRENVRPVSITINLDINKNKSYVPKKNENYMFEKILSANQYWKRRDTTNKRQFHLLLEPPKREFKNHEKLNCIDFLTIC